MREEGEVDFLLLLLRHHQFGGVRISALPLYLLVCCSLFLWVYKGEKKPNCVCRQGYFPVGARLYLRVFMPIQAKSGERERVDGIKNGVTIHRPSSPFLLLLPSSFFIAKTTPSCACNFRRASPSPLSYPLMDDNGPARNIVRTGNSLALKNIFSYLRSGTARMRGTTVRR